MASSRTRSQSSSSVVVWILAGIIALVAISVSALHQQTSTPPDTNIVDTMQRPIQAPRLDTVFVIDATGSMSDEIDMVKKEIRNIAQRLAQGTPKPDIRYGLVFYQDRTGAPFLTRNTPLTRDIQTIYRELEQIEATGGGDWQEHVGRGLHDALAMQWDLSQNVSRSIYLVGDAPGHDDYQDGFSIASAIQKAKQKNIVIHAIGCSGLNAGREEFQRIAQNTGGTYNDLTYQSVITDSTGKKNSVIYYNGEYYEADEVLKKDDWGRGAGALLNEKRLRRARPASRAKAEGGELDNNLDNLIETGNRAAAEDLGVDFK